MKKQNWLLDGFCWLNCNFNGFLDKEEIGKRGSLFYPCTLVRMPKLKLKSKGTLVTMRLIGILCKTKIISVNYAENPVGNLLVY